jgi:hypothetical protein
MLLKNKDIKIDEKPLYNVFPSDITDDMPIDNQREAMAFMTKTYQLIDGNDVCDKQGIRYLGKYMKHYCIDSTL